MYIDNKDLQNVSWEEIRRYRACELLERHWPQKYIGEALGVNQSTISNWAKKLKEGGKEALKIIPQKGPTPRLTEDQKKELPKFLEKGAEAYGFRGNFWTQKRVAVVIEKEFGVSYHYTTAGRIVREIGWSCQKPALRARQSNEEEIQDWKEHKWPELKKNQKKKKEQ